MWKIAVTGHRPNKLYGYNLYDPGWINLGKKMRNFLLDRLDKHQEIECITGMALGVDQLYGLVALKLREQNKKVRIFAAVPCREQEKKWKTHEHYDRLIKEADEVFYVHDGPYTDKCMQDRNIFMCARCNELLAVWDGTPGGTKNCINYAKAINKPIINLLEQKE